MTTGQELVTDPHNKQTDIQQHDPSEGVEGERGYCEGVEGEEGERGYCEGVEGERGYCEGEEGERGYSTPELPTGQQLVLNLLTTWGDQFYVGLTGLEIFTASGERASVTQVQQLPHFIHE